MRLVQEHHQHNRDPIIGSIGTRRGPKPDGTRFLAQAAHVLAHTQVFANQQRHFMYWTSYSRVNHPVRLLKPSGSGDIGLYRVYPGSRVDPKP